MATVTSNKASAGVQPHGLRVGLVCTTAVYSPNGSMSSGDVIQMVKVPANSSVSFVSVHYALSGNGSVTVGDGVDPDRYVQAVAASVSSPAMLFPGTIQGFVPYVYSTDDTIDITISASTNPSSGAVYMTAIIAMDR